MSRTTTTAYYPFGTVRARRWREQGDIRCYRPPRDWTATADLTDIYPITGRLLPDSAWWIIEVKA